MPLQLVPKVFGVNDLGKRGRVFSIEEDHREENIIYKLWDALICLSSESTRKYELERVITGLFGFFMCLFFI